MGSDSMFLNGCKSQPETYIAFDLMKILENQNKANFRCCTERLWRQDGSCVSDSFSYAIILRETETEVKEEERNIN